MRSLETRRIVKRGKLIYNAEEKLELRKRMMIDGGLCALAVPERRK